MEEPEEVVPPFVTRDFALQAIQVRNLTNAIRELEWGGPFANGFCPCCGSRRAHGHAEGCSVWLALSPDHGVAAMKESVANSLQIVAQHRYDLQQLVGMAVRELDDLESALTDVQSLMYLL